jgi:hypothetical protein
MNDRERAQELFLRRLLELDRHRVAELLGEAMQHLMVAVGAELVFLACSDGFELACSVRDLDLDPIRALAREKRPATIDSSRANIWLPVVGVGLRGVVHLHTKAVFVASDIELIELFTRRFATVAHAVHAPPDLHTEALILQYRRVRETLERNGGNVSNAARDLGVPRSFLYRVLRRFEHA